jgi:hypothetical protein
MSSVEPLCSVRHANEMRLMGSWQKRRSACKSLNCRYEIRRSDIAVASLNGMEFLLTWNFSHINNAFKKSRIIKAIEDHGLVPPEICSPEELVGD